MKLTTKRSFIYLFIAILFISLFFRYAHRAPKRHYCDFRVYYATAQRFIAKEDIYSRPDEAITPFKYSPLFAYLVSPLSLISQKTASLIFFSISFFSLIVILVLSKKLIVKEALTFKQSILLYALPTIFTSRFIFSVLDSGQVTIIMFLFVILGLYFAEKKKNILASLFLGLSLMFKYTSVLFLPYFVFRKKIIIVTLTLVFIGLYCFLPAIHLGLGQEMQYLKKWLPFISETSLDKGSWFDSKNQSLYSFILRLFAKDSAFKPIAQLTFFQGVAVATAIGLIMYLLIILPGRKNKNNTFIDYSLILICMALFNPNAWLANFVFFVFAYMVIAHHLIKVRYKDKVTLVLMILSFIVSSWVSESMVGDKLQNLFEALSTVTIAALILVGILLRLKFKKEITKSQDTIILKDRPR